MVTTSLSSRELIRELRALHLKHGNEDLPSLAVADAVRRICKEMRVRGIYPRYIDELASATQTLPTHEGTPPPTVEEIVLYAEPVRLDRAAVCLAKRLGTDDGTIYVTLRSPLLATMASSIVQAVKRAMPAGVDVAPVAVLEESASFLQAQVAYALELVPASLRDPIVTTVQAQLRPPGKVFKSWSSKVPFRALKSMAPERIVTGVVLEPDTIDGTQTEDSAGDIYSAEEIQKGMYYWMENAGTPFSFHHVEQGGQRLEPGDVVLLENWQERNGLRIGQQDIKPGAWMMTSRINHTGLWDAILKGEVNSYSLGLNAAASLENIAQSF